MKKKNKPLHIRSDSTVFFDVDETLISWNRQHNIKGEDRLPFKDPYGNETFYLKPHKVHIRLLKQFKGRGYTVIVWSKQGDRWAKEVVYKLGIQDHVDIIMSKPDKFVDDKDNLADIVGSRIYFKDT